MGKQNNRTGDDSLKQEFESITDDLTSFVRGNEKDKPVKGKQGKKEKDDGLPENDNTGKADSTNTDIQDTYPSPPPVKEQDVVDESHISHDTKDEQGNTRGAARGQANDRPTSPIPNEPSPISSGLVDDSQISEVIGVDDDGNLLMGQGENGAARSLALIQAGDDVVSNEELALISYQRGDRDRAKRLIGVKTDREFNSWLHEVQAVRISGFKGALRVNAIEDMYNGMTELIERLKERIPEMNDLNLIRAIDMLGLRAQGLEAVKDTGVVPGVNKREWSESFTRTISEETTALQSSDATAQGIDHALGRTKRPNDLPKLPT